MMSTKIPVAILGATGSVGQRLIGELASHPWFEITEISASDKSAGKRYEEATHWILSTPIPDHIRTMVVLPCSLPVRAKIVFSALSSNVAGPLEEEFAGAGHIVISMAKNNRMRADVPMLIPEVNPEHVSLTRAQKYPSGGMIITKPNCSVIGLAMALCPLERHFGIDSVSVVTMQSASGAGYPGVPSLALFDNIIPYIEDEEEKLEMELGKIFGTVSATGFVPHSMKISATCTRVPVTEGHLEIASVKFKSRVALDDVKDAWRNFLQPEFLQGLPHAPSRPIIYSDDVAFPQPRLQRDYEKGMAVTIGRLRECPLFDCKFALLSHNTLRGAAGGAVLIAEMLASGEFHGVEFACECETSCTSRGKVSATAS
jgi:aspartate-semialdehyde dehydrogenase